MEGQHHDVMLYVPIHNSTQIRGPKTRKTYSVWVLLWILSLGSFCEAFLPIRDLTSSSSSSLSNLSFVSSTPITPPSVGNISRVQWHATSSLSLAKNTNKKNKRVSRSNRRRGEKDDTCMDSTTDTDNGVANRPRKVSVLPRPPLTKRTFAFSRPHEQPPLQVVALQVEDPSWWQLANDAVEASGDDSSNPFGARMWPSALGIAQFLVEYNDRSEVNAMVDRPILELGCGGGLCSIVAASLGGQVVASDISRTVLELTNLGWAATCKQLQKKRAKDEQTNLVTSTGSLQTATVDLASTAPLPVDSTSTNHQPIVMAAAMLYSNELALLLARRTFEATHHYNAWVIIGDDDSGERGGGRQQFLEEWDRLEAQAEKCVPCAITRSVVKNQALKWSEKRIQLIHLNHPNDIDGA